MTHEEEALAKQFLNTAWQSHTENYKEKDNQAARELRIYDKIKTEAENQPELMKLLTDLENASIRYLQTVYALSKVKAEKRSEGIIFEYDQARKLAHNVCIDELNLLSRQFRAAGLDNEWRRQIGLDRELIGHWARAVGQYLVGASLEEYEDDDSARI